MSKLIFQQRGNPSTRIPVSQHRTEGGKVLEDNRAAFAAQQLKQDETAQAKSTGQGASVQREEQPAKPNNTGLPGNLKSGIEALSGLSMDKVKVHYNSTKPAQLNALAYAQGTDIHVGPGQEQHLPHEAWHVVQQAQGRVKPTMQMKESLPVNNDKSLEHEADMMGKKAVQRMGKTVLIGLQSTPNASVDTYQLVKDDIDVEKFKLFIRAISDAKKELIIKENRMPDKSTEDLKADVIARIRAEIDEKEMKQLQELYKEGKAPDEPAILKNEVKDFFDENFNTESVQKRIESWVNSHRRNQLEERQKGVKDKAFPDLKTTPKTVTVYLENNIKTSTIDWDVIWNKIISYGFYPTHVVVPQINVYTDDLKQGSHFRNNSSTVGNYFYEVNSDETTLTMHIHDFWANKHPDSKHPWGGIPKNASYTKHEFKVTGTGTKRRTKKPSKMTAGKKDSSQTWDLTEAQLLALDMNNLASVPVDPDGFCLTQALGVSMNSDGQTVRDNVINNLSNNAADGEMSLRIIEAFDSVDNFITQLTDRAAWAGPFGEMIISGIALVLNLNIGVFNEVGTITPVQTPDATETVYISRIVRGGSGHFAATRTK
ncbi:MAG: eCIS core domain-containing protein [Methylobacter sp.]